MSESRPCASQRRRTPRSRRLPPPILKARTRPRRRRPPMSLPMSPPMTRPRPGNLRRRHPPRPADSATVTAANPALSAGNPAAAPPAAPGGLDNVLRVDAERIDSVLNLVGELILAKSMLQQTLLKFGQRFPKDVLRGKFSDAMAFQGRGFKDLQHSA